MRARPTHWSMPTLPAMSVSAILAWVLLAAASGIAPAAELTIYRCTDGKGRLTLRDTPCLPGERQQTREMLRPTDPRPRPIAPVVKPAYTPAPAAPTRVLVITAPRPLYECVTPDGDRYTSDTAEGDPRWVPLWTLGYPVVGYTTRIRGTSLGNRIGAPSPKPPAHRPGVNLPPRHHGAGYAYPAGTWVRDACHALPPQEVCARLRDRRYELDRSYYSSLQSERRRITLEKRGIDARLSNDCGA